MAATVSKRVRSNRRGRGVRNSTAFRVALAALAVCLTALLTVTVFAQGDGDAIERFERRSPVATATLNAGDSLEDAGLPDTLRAIVPLSDEELAEATFEQTQPEVDMSDGYSYYDYYEYGYVVPADADELYAAGDLAIYTITYAAEDGEGVGETAYRIYGSLNGGDATWYACDEEGAITGVIVDVPVTWEGDYDADVAGEYTLTASFSGYIYAEAHPYVTVTVQGETEDATEESDSDEETVAAECTCSVGGTEYSSDHATDCPYYMADAVVCTCELQSIQRGPDHAEDCPYYTAPAEGCTCGEDGGPIAADNYPWAHDVSCLWYSPAECTCRELIEVTEEESVDGISSLQTTYYYGDFTHEHDPDNEICELYGVDTVEIEKSDETALSSQLLGSTASAMAVDDAQEVVAYQEEQAAEDETEDTAVLYTSLGAISIVEGSEQAAPAAAISTLSDNGGGSIDAAMDAFMEANTSTVGNRDYTDSSFTGGLTIPGAWIDYVNTIWMNKGYTGFSWTADGDTGAYGGWAWGGGTANSTSGSTTSSATRRPARTTSGEWVVYSGEQLLYALNNFTSGDTIRLGGNINMNGDDHSWSVVSINGKSLTIDGDGYAIYNLGNYQTTASSQCVFLMGINAGFTVTDLDFVTMKFIQAVESNHCSLFTSTNRLQNDSSRKVVRLDNVNIIDSMFYSISGVVSPFGKLTMDRTEEPVETDTFFLRMVPYVTNCSAEGNFLYAGSDHLAGFCMGIGPTYLRYNDDREAWWGTFQNCYSVDNLMCGTGGHSAGFASCNGAAAYIDNCFAVNEQYGSVSVSGFIGLPLAEVTNCYASGKLEGYAILGGFAFDAGDGTSTNPRVFENCYSTVLVGLRSEPTRQGGFSAAQSNSISYTTFTNCYAAGEVGNFTLDMNNPESVGGFLDYSDTKSVSNRCTFTDCYYDKQTTAMREWVTGEDELSSATDSWNNITGVLTTDTSGGLSGLTGSPGSSGFTGFTDNSDWVYTDERYPQLAVFAEASASEWGSDEVADLVKAYSLVSTSTAMLETWDSGYTWDSYGVRSDTEVSWDAAGSGGDNAGGQLTYDTVRDITTDFTVTSATEWVHLVNSGDTVDGEGAPSETTDSSGNITTTRRTVSIDSAASTGTTESPGMDWFGIQATYNNTTAQRPIRLIAYMSIEAGDNQTISSGETYDHRDDVEFAMVDELVDDLVMGIDDSEIWSKSISRYWPTETGTTTQVNGYYDVTTEESNHTASKDAIVNTEIWAAEIDTQDGGVAAYPTAGTDGDYYYYADGNYYIKADAAVNVTGSGSEGDIDRAKWRGETPLYSDTSTSRAYIVSYYWILEDGRYNTDYKIIMIERGDYTVEIEVQNLDGSLNGDLLTLDVAADNGDGSFAYDVNGQTSSYDELDSSDATSSNSGYYATDNSVYYTTNVTAAWKKASEHVVVQGASITLYYRDGTQAGTGTLIGSVEDGSEITIRTLLYYFDTIEITDGTDREYTQTQEVDITYTVVEVKDASGNGTGEYYLRFNKLANDPDGEWTGALAGENDGSGIVTADGTPLPDELYINDLQFDVKIVLTVTGGTIGGLAWVDANDDGVQNDDVGSTADGYTTVGGITIPNSAKSLYGLDEANDTPNFDGFTVTLMRSGRSGGYEAVVPDSVWDETEGDYVANDSNVPIYVTTQISDDDATTTFIASIDNVSYTITATATRNGGYYFGGLPAGTYAVVFSTDEFPLGAYEVADRDAGDDDTIDSDATGRYVNRPDGTESATGGSGYWLSSAIVEGITIPDTPTQSHADYVSLHNDCGFVPLRGSIKIAKTDEDGSGLEGVTFTLELLMNEPDEGAEGEDADWVAWSTISGENISNDTGSGGSLTYSNLIPGTYRLTETGSTSGNSLLADAITIVIPFSSDASSSTDTTAPSYAYDNESYWLDVGYNITNASLFTLPMAGGGLPRWAWLVIGLGVVAAAFVVRAAAKNRSRSQRVDALRGSLGIRA